MSKPSPINTAPMMSNTVVVKPVGTSFLGMHAPSWQVCASLTHLESQRTLHLPFLHLRPTGHAFLSHGSALSTPQLLVWVTLSVAMFPEFTIMLVQMTSGLSQEAPREVTG